MSVNFKENYLQLEKKRQIILVYYLDCWIYITNFFFSEQVDTGQISEPFLEIWVSWRDAISKWNISFQPFILLMYCLDRRCGCFPVGNVHLGFITNWCVKPPSPKGSRSLSSGSHVQNRNLGFLLHITLWKKYTYSM